MLREAFQCEIGTNKDARLRVALGVQKIPKLVPQRARDVLCRGAYLRVGKMAKFLWGMGSS